MAVIESEVQDAQESGKMWTGAAIEVERFLMNDMDHRVIGGRLILPRESTRSCSR